MAQDEKMLVPVRLLARCADLLEDPKAEHPHDVSYLIEELRALSAAPAQPAAVEGAGEPVAWQAMKEGRPLGSVWPYANRSGADLWVAGGVGDAVRPLYAHPSPRADDALRLAAIVAKNMADNASFNLNQAGLTIETAACDRAFVDIYRTLDAALKAGGVK